MVTSLPTAYLFFAAAAVLLALPKGQARGILLLAVPLLLKRKLPSMLF